MKLTQSLLKELIHYDPETGVFTWLPRDRKHFASSGSCKSWNTQHANKMAQALDYEGYVYIMIFNHKNRAHRLAWLYVHGHLPPDQIDHINGIPSDNRLCNLRAVSNQENGKNRKISKNNTSGVIGVHMDKSVARWVAQISKKGRLLRLGGFDYFFEAVCARKSAENKCGYHPNHGRKK